MRRWRVRGSSRGGGEHGQERLLVVFPVYQFQQLPGFFRDDGHPLAHLFLVGGQGWSSGK